MKNLEKHTRQGDVYFDIVDSIPSDATLVEQKNGAPVVVAHSETGHDHSFPSGSAVELFATKDPFVCYLRCEAPSTLEHHRDHHTHESILFPAGFVRVTRQREMAHTPEGWRERMVQD